MVILLAKWSAGMADPCVKPAGALLQSPEGGLKLAGPLRDLP
jgi:hypothetical protein